jgi:hypothetical protein
MASYVGSSDNGLGFFYIDLPEVETTKWLNINKCGIAMIKSGIFSWWS